MPISEVIDKLNAQPLVDELLANLTGPLASLSATTAPANTQELEDHPGAQASADTGAIHAATASLSALVPNVLSALPLPNDALAPLLSAITLVEQVTTTDLVADVRGLLDRLGRDLAPGPGTDFLQVLSRLGAELGNARELSALLGLLSTAFRASGLDLKPQELLSGVLPAVSGGARALGTLMSLESVLSEGERLARIVATQLDGPSLELEVAGLQNDYATAASYIASLTAAIDSASPAEIDAAVRGLAACNARLAALESFLSRGLGFGEATLVHLDLPALTARSSELAGSLGRTDLAAIARVVQSLADRVASVVQLDLGTPVESLEALLTLLEQKSQDVANAINALDLTQVTAPIERGLAAATGVIGDAGAVMTQIMTTLRGALESVKQAIKALPFDEIANAIDALLAPIRAAMQAIGDLIGGIEAALQTAATAMTDALGSVETAVDTFKAQVESLLKDAADFIEGLHLDQVIGAVADKVNAFADTLGQVQMAPYFDSANAVIGTAADVIENLPLSLLPDSVKSELDQAAAPVRAIDLPGLENEVLGWFEIRDGKFALRAPLEDALSDLQTRYDALVTSLGQADPRRFIEPINAELANVRARVDELFPALNLEPIRAAIARVKQALAGIDVRALLQPVEQVFGQLLAAIDQYSPAALLVPIEQRVDEAREKLITTIKLDDWAPALERISNSAKSVVDELDPALLEPMIEGGLSEARRLAEQLEGVQLGQAFGDLLASVLSGTGQVIQPRAIGAVLSYFAGTDGSAALSARTASMQRALASTHAAVSQLDLAALSGDLRTQVAALRAALGHLPEDNATRAQLAPLVDRAAALASFSGLTANRTRYLGLLTAAQGQAADLARVGVSQIAVTVRGLSDALAGFSPLRLFFERMLAQIGVRGLDAGIAALLQRVLATLTPQRATAIFTPIFSAVRGRIVGLVDVVVHPLLDGITQLHQLIDAFDLTPLREGLEQIVNEAKQQIELLRPSVLLGPTLDAFDALKTELTAFDPIAPIEAVLHALQSTIDRVIDKLDAAELLAQPIRIYDEIMKALRALDLQRLLEPVLDTLDDLAGQIDGGLDSTVSALERLQAALPAPGSGGGGELSGSIG